MKRYILILILVLIAGCQGGAGTSQNPASPSENTGDPAVAGPIDLQLSAMSDGANERVVLTARDARDLYQIASTIVYDPARYEVLSIEAGGGLGMPEDSYFVAGEPESGRIDFAYTKRFSGPGASGDVNLLHIVVRPLDKFRLSDFRMDNAPGTTLVRDSRKRDVEAHCNQEVAQ